MSEHSIQQACGMALLSLFLAIPVAAQENDPMRPPQARQAPTQVSSPSWDLSSILISDSRRLAVINNQVVRIGDWVGSARVDRIEADRVVLQRGEQSMTLTLRINLNIHRSEGD